MSWFITALVASIAQAITFDVNRTLQMNAVVLVYWRSLLSVVLFLPLFLFVDLQPLTPAFWLVCGYAAVSAALGLTIQSYLSARGGGRVASLVMPLKVLFAFVIWLAIDEAYRQGLVAEPVKAFLLALCFTSSMLAMNFMRRSDMGLLTLLLIVPDALLYALYDVLAKYVLEINFDLNALLAFALLCNIFMAVLMQGMVLWPAQRGVKVRPSGHQLSQAAKLAVLSAICWVLMPLSLVLAENPAYPGMVMMLAPVWLTVYYRWARVKDEAHPWAGFVMVLAALGVAFLSGN